MLPTCSRVLLSCILLPAPSTHYQRKEVPSSLSLILALHNGVIVPASKDHCEHLNSLNS